MIKGIDFVVFSDDWGRHPFSCQHIMKRFLPYNRILWVNTIGMRPPQFSLYDFQRLGEKLAEWWRPDHTGAEHPDNLSVISPIAIPYNMVPAIRRLNRRVGLSMLQRKMNNGFKNPVVIATVLNSVDFIGCLNESVSVYYCVDEFNSYPGLPTTMISQMERDLLAKVDLVVATSRELQRRKSNGVRDTLLLPHGVDFENFAPDLDGTMPGVLVMDGLEGPIIGFFGVLSDWVDLGLIEEIATLRRDWSWVLIGPSQTNLDRLRQHPNIFLVGKVDYAVLPQYARRFDVGIIPFRVNDLTINVNPLKLLEYLACGLPVVSTPIPEVVRYGDLVATAESAKEFVAAIEHALATNTPEKIRLRVGLAMNNSWDARAEEFSGAIESLLGSKPRV